MQAGQARKRLTFRDIFTSIHIFWGDYPVDNVRLS